MGTLDPRLLAISNAIERPAALRVTVADMLALILACLAITGWIIATP